MTPKILVLILLIVVLAGGYSFWKYQGNLKTVSTPSASATTTPDPSTSTEFEKEIQGLNIDQDNLDLTAVDRDIQSL